MGEKIFPQGVFTFDEGRKSKTDDFAFTEEDSSFKV